MLLLLLLLLSLLFLNRHEYEECMNKEINSNKSAITNDDYILSQINYLASNKHNNNFVRKNLFQSLRFTNKNKIFNLQKQ